MGVTHVTATVRNPADPERTWEGLFLVDTGETDCLVPRQHLEAIGLEPESERVYSLADGSEHRMSVTVARIEFMGEVVGATIVMGKRSRSRCWESRRWSRWGLRWIHGIRR